MDDPDLARLEAVGVPFDPLAVLRWGHREAPHTRFLAWLLDPSPSDLGAQHGLDAAVLEALVARALASIETLPGADLGAMERSGRVTCSAVRVIREVPVGDGVHATARAPDVRCEFVDATGRGWLVMIENKVDAAEGTGQVRAYLAWARAQHADARRLLLFITPDGRAPDSELDGELTVSLSWASVADAALGALDDRDDHEHLEARSFARSVLISLRHRFGGDRSVRAIVQTLHERHPRAAARVASLAIEATRVARLTARFPSATWHLRTVRPSPRAWTQTYARDVARAFAALHRGGLTLRPCAPHVAWREGASWTIDGVTETLSLVVHAGSGRPFGGHHARLWVGLYAPGHTVDEALRTREQREAVEALPEATRRWLLGARPVLTSGDAWRYLCVGEAATLPRGFTPEDDALRAATLLDAMLAPHATALRELAQQEGLRLYSCDLDPLHVADRDARDRDAMERCASPDAQRVWIVERSPRGHMIESLHERTLGATLSAAFGGLATLRYTYAPSPDARVDQVVLGTHTLRSPDDEASQNVKAALSRAVAQRASVLVLGDEGPTDFAAGRWVIEGLDLFAPVVRVFAPEHRAPEEGEFRVAAAGSMLATLVTRDARAVGGVRPLGVRAEAEVLASYVPARGEAAGRECAWIARWRVGGTTVLYWGGGALGPWAATLHDRPEVFARWWQQITSMA